MFRAEPTGVRNPPSVASRTIDSAAAVIVGAAFSTLLLLACRAYAQMPEGFDRLLLVDANGRRIGIVTEFGEGAATTHMKVGDLIFRLDVSRQDFAPFRRQVYFQDSVCRDGPFVQVYPAEFTTLPTGLTEAVVNRPGNTVYAAETQEPPQTMTMGSLFGTDGSCIATQTQGDFVHARVLVDLSALFVPPFRVVAESSPCGDCNADGTVSANEITRVVLNVFAAGAPSSQRAR